MSFKAIILLTRAAGSTHDSFAAWWLTDHAPLAARLPGLRRAVFNLVDDPADGDPDGVSELWFDTKADFETAYTTEIGRAVVADTMTHVADRRRVFVTEHALVG